MIAAPLYRRGGSNIYRRPAIDADDMWTRRGRKVAGANRKNFLPRPVERHRLPGLPDARIFLLIGAAGWNHVRRGVSTKHHAKDGREVQRSNVFRRSQSFR